MAPFEPDRAQTPNNAFDGQRGRPRPFIEKRGRFDVFACTSTLDDDIRLRRAEADIATEQEEAHQQSRDQTECGATPKTPACPSRDKIAASVLALPSASKPAFVQAKSSSKR